MRKANTIEDVKFIARRYTKAAVEVLCNIMVDPTAPPAARVMAANSILDRGHGKPNLQIQIDAEIKRYVVVVPETAKNIDEWIASYKPKAICS